MNIATSRLAAQSLPTIAGGGITYNAERNVFLTSGYTSAAGNMYYRAVRLSPKLAICFDLGQGYSHGYTFLNGITLMCWEGQQARVIAKKQWGGRDNWVAFSESFAKQQSIQMLTDYLRGQQKLLGGCICDSEIRNLATGLVEEAQKKLLA